MDTNTVDIKDLEKDLETENVKSEVGDVVSPEDLANMPILEEMVKAGIMYGRKKSKMNPKMKPYIFAIRSGIAIFDLPKSLKNLKESLEFVKGLVKAGNKILVVGTQPSAKELVKEFAEKFDQLYVNERWLGGMLTNFKTISARIEYFKKLKSDLASGRLDKYTKKERLMIEREIERLNLFFSGVENMKVLPAAILLINPVFHETALREARRIKIPVISFMSSDANPEEATYPITGNCNARPSITWVIDQFSRSLEEAKSVAPTVPVANNIS